MISSLIIGGLITFLILGLIALIDKIRENSHAHTEEDRKRLGDIIRENSEWARKELKDRPEKGTLEYYKRYYKEDIEKAKKRTKNLVHPK